MMKYLVNILCLLILAIGLSAQTVNRPDLAQALLEALLQEQQLPGVAAVVATADSILWKGQVGYANIELEVPIHVDSSLFRVGSISKTFTAALMGKLFEEGKLDFKADVEDYYPEYPNAGKGVSIKWVAGHLGGIRHYRGNEFLMNKPFHDVQSSLKIFESDSLVAKPGTSYSYSSYGYNLLSYVIERIVKVPFPTYIKDELFSAMGMSLTLAEVSGQRPKGIVQFYEYKNGKVEPAPTVDNSYKWAGGGFLAPASDVAKFAQSFLRHDYLQESTFAFMSAPQHTDDGESTGYGMGWRTFTSSAGYTAIGHSGGSVGGTSLMLIFPAQGIVSVVLTNLSSASISQTCNALATLFMD